MTKTSRGAIALLALCTVAALAAGCNNDNGSTGSTSNNQRAAAPPAGEEKLGKIKADVKITGALTDSISGTGGTCEPARWALMGVDFGAANNFSLELENDSMPKMALNLNGDSFLAIKSGSKGTFDIKPDKITLDLDVPSFKNKTIHMKGTMTCVKS